MSISGIAFSAVAANHAQTTQAMTNAVIRQQHAAEEAIVQVLSQAVAQAASTSGGVDITV